MRYGELKRKAEMRAQRMTHLLQRGASEAELLALAPIVQTSPGLKAESLRLLLSPQGPKGTAKDQAHPLLAPRTRRAV